MQIARLPHVLPQRSRPLVRLVPRGDRSSASARDVLPGDQVQWGVVRKHGCFDLGDSTQHTGLTQHAFPLGQDGLAVCGFRTPLNRAHDGAWRPLLTMPSTANPRCKRCARWVLPFARTAGHPEEETLWPMHGPISWLEGRLRACGVEIGRGWMPLRPVVAVSVRPEHGDRPVPDAGPGPEPAAEGRESAAIPPWMRRLQPVAVPIHAGSPSVTAGPDGRRAYMVEDRAARLGY